MRSCKVLPLETAKPLKNEGLAERQCSAGDAPFCSALHWSAPLSPPANAGALQFFIGKPSEVVEPAIEHFLEQF
jgi:hypothetical protein